ncbi:MAG: TlpA disulfide reductase family protein [Steroidobacteraceae bacterium]
MSLRMLAHRSVALVLLGSVLFNCSAQAGETLKVGDSPPPKLGWHVKLSDYRGKVVVVSFWASWCPPCRKEIGVLAALQKQATRSKVVVFAVNWREDRSVFRQVEHLLRSQGFDLSLVSDDDGYIGRQYGIDAIPHMFIIGRDGRIAAIHVGYGESELPIIANEINELWNKPASP